MQRIHFGSPSKQNQHQISSPTKNSKKDILTQITLYLKSNGVVLPNHINKLILNNPNFQSPQKNKNTQDHQKLINKLNYELSQANFNKKKIEEDFAQFKRTSKIQKDKQSKKNQEIINKLKLNIEQLTQDSEYKNNKLMKQNTNQINSLKERYKLQIEQATKSIKSQLQLKLQNNKKIYQREIQQINQKWQKKYNQKVKQVQNQISKMKIKYEDEIKKINIKNKQMIEDKQKRHQSVRVAIQSQKKTQQKLHQKTKIQFKKQVQQLNSDLCFEKNVNQHLKEEIQIKNLQIKKLKSAINDLELDLILLEEKKNKKIKQIQERFEQNIKKIQSNRKQQLSKLKQKQLIELSNFQKKIQNIQKTYKQKQSTIIQSLEEVTVSFQKRPSKKQDLTEIDKLKWALTRKQQQNKKLIKQLRACNLQLQNKQEVYTRIFRANSMSRQKKSNRDKQQKQQAIIQQKIGKEQIFRKSQTADVKFLLKIYNNNNKNF